MIEKIYRINNTDYSEIPFDEDLYHFIIYCSDEIYVKLYDIDNPYIINIGPKISKAIKAKRCDRIYVKSTKQDSTILSITIKSTFKAPQAVSLANGIVSFVDLVEEATSFSILNTSISDAYYALNRAPSPGTDYTMVVPAGTCVVNDDDCRMIGLVSFDDITVIVDGDKK